MGADLDRLLTALADPTRRSVVERLLRGPRRAGELADACGATAPTMSKHLRVLREHGLVEELRDPDDARVRMFALRREPISALRTWLDEVEAFWNDQLSAFRGHADGRRRRKRR